MYDPFYIGQDGDPEAQKKKLVSLRRPPIFDAKLYPMQWDASGGDALSRKRSRDHHSHREGGSQTNNTKREVVRVVEKVVNVEPSTIMGVAPLVDDRVRYVVNFILEHVTSPHVEIEAKLGTLIEKEQNLRAVELVPVLCETPIIPESNKDTRFQSNVGGEVFTSLNARLNKRVEETTNQETGQIRYLRTKEMDVFWPGKIRETRERRRGPDGTEEYHTVRTQQKTRLGDLNVLCPGRIADIRYSASEEKDCAVPENASPVMQRIKDRISYKYEYLSVDMTRVEMQGANSEGSTTTLEVEVEIDTQTDLYGEVIKFRQGDETSKLFDIAASMVNTVRLLLEG